VAPRWKNSSDTLPAKSYYLRCCGRCCVRQNIYAVQNSCTDRWLSFRQYESM